MFGFGKKHDESWVSAPAEVVEAEQSNWAITSGNPAIVGNTEIRWKLHVRVRPEGEAPFEAKFNASLPQLSHPRAGTMLAVRFDAGDRSKVELDPDSGAQAQAALAGVLDHNPRLASATVGGVSVADMMQSALRDPNAFRAQMEQQAAAMQADAMRQQAEMMAAAQKAQAEAMAAAQAAQAQAAAASGAAPASASPSSAGLGSASAPGAPVSAAPPADDRIAQLERIAGLRDRGVLTEDEF